DYDLRSLRYITQAGGAMPRATIERLRAATPGIEIFVMYGQTEATARLTYLPPTRLDEKLGSVGVAIDGVEIDVRDDQDRCVPTETTGEICARGPNVMLGYWNDPEATGKVLRGGWLRTGDLGHRDRDGYLYIDGRAAEMIKTGAFRVSPQEVEEAICALADVQEVAVSGIADDMLGQAILAVIIPKPASSLDVRTIKAHCHQCLAPYKVPKQVEFVAEFPRTASGKVQRLELARKVNR
ncbi:MAG: fatty acid--CoA ligase family protein, partial [Nitrococcus sp.]|nr:fatty acid--CoA ligase family protein [Nitrococcus sp.]